MAGGFGALARLTAVAALVSGCRLACELLDCSTLAMVDNGRQSKPSTEWTTGNWRRARSNRFRLFRLPSGWALGLSLGLDP